MSENLIIVGDNYEKSREILEPKSIQLVLTDPLWDTNVRWLATNNEGEIGYYEDNVFKSIWHYLEWLERIFRPLKEEYLKPSGWFCNHISPELGHYVKVYVLDKIFTPFPKHFVNEVAWCYSRWMNSTPKQLPDTHHHIYTYVMSHKDAVWNPIKVPLDVPRKRNLVKDRQVMRDEFGNVVYRTQTDRPIRDWWTSINPVPPKGGERVDYPTQKPLALYRRFIELMTNPGDIVFDPFMGSGTVPLAAYQTGRRFIGIDHEQSAINKTIERLDAAAAPYTIINGGTINKKGLDEMSDYEYQCHFIEQLGGVARGRGPDGAVDGFIASSNTLVAVTRRQVGRRDVDIFQSALRREGKKNGIMIAGGGFSAPAEEEIVRLRFNKELNIEQKHEKDFGFNDPKVKIEVEGTIFRVRTSGFRNPVINYSWFVDDYTDGYGGNALFGSGQRHVIKEDPHGVQDFGKILSDGNRHRFRCVVADKSGEARTDEISYKI
jgi:DNA modification methylase